MKYDHVKTRDVNRMPLEDIEREIALLESIQRGRRTVDDTRRLEALRVAANEIRTGGHPGCKLS